MAMNLGQITDADIYIDGTDVKRQVAEFSLDDLEHTEVEHSSLGMVAVLNLPGRPVKAISGKIKFAWLDAALERQLANPTKRTKLQMHSYVDAFDADGLREDASHTLVTHLGFHVMKRGLLGSKLGDAAGVEHAISVSMISQKVYGESEDIFTLDVFAGIYKVNGQAVWKR